MSEPRFTTLTPATMTADQKRVADAIQSGPRGAGLRGPFVNDTFGERGVVDLVGAVGYYSLVSMTLNVAQVPLPAGVTPPLK
jgi:4-carboxymuconolactone decarboxylase